MSGKKVLVMHSTLVNHLTEQGLLPDGYKIIKSDTLTEEPTVKSVMLDIVNQIASNPKDPRNNDYRSQKRGRG